MTTVCGAAAAPDPFDVASDPLQYQKRLRFPKPLEDAYRRDYANRFMVMHRHFVAFGFVMFGLFGILDYFAMPRTHAVAWELRAAVEPFAIFLFWASYQRALRRHMHWLMNLWMLAMNFAILGMIMRAQQSEVAFTFYPIGLMLVFIGFKKFSYDLWGDTVNVASRMESSGIPGEIQVTRDAYQLLKPGYVLQKRGALQIKGKGEMQVYLLKGRKKPQQEAAPAAEHLLAPGAAD